MLRGLVGDTAFFEGIKRYYTLYRGRNVWTKDFRTVMESAAGMDLSSFFRQWLHQPGWPEYRLEWKWIEPGRSVAINISQIQSMGLFDMPLDLVLSFGSRKEIHRIRIKDTDSSFQIPAQSSPSSVEIDPDGWILKIVSVLN